jgi:hypothetical protein
MERAAGGQGSRIGRLTADDGPLAQAVGGIRLGHGRQQRLRVGVEWTGHEIGRGRQLHDAPRVHDRDALREVPSTREVVRDVEDGQPVLRLQLVEEIQDLGPAGGVDHRDRLVGHQILRPQHHGPRDADALALATRERVRVLLDHLGGRPQLDLLERRQDSRVTLAAVPGAVDDEWLLHDLPHPHVRAEAGVGVLEDRLCTLAETGQVAALELADVDSPEDDAAPGERDEAQRRPTQRRLAAARLADHGDGLAALERQRDVGDRMDRPAPQK